MPSGDSAISAKRAWLAQLAGHEVVTDDPPQQEDAPPTSGPSVSGRAAAKGGTHRWTFERNDVGHKMIARRDYSDAEMPLTALAVSVWCDLPDAVWQDLAADGGFADGIDKRIEGFCDSLVSDIEIIYERGGGDHGSSASNQQESNAPKTLERFMQNYNRAKDDWEERCRDLVRLVFADGMKAVAGAAVLAGNARHAAAFAHAKLVPGARVTGTFGRLASLPAQQARTQTPAYLLPVLASELLGAQRAIAFLVQDVQDLGMARDGLIGLLDSYEVTWTQYGGEALAQTVTPQDAASLLKLIGPDDSSLASPTLSYLSSRFLTLGARVEGIPRLVREIDYTFEGLNKLLKSLDAVLQPSEAPLARVANVRAMAKTMLTATVSTERTVPALDSTLAVWNQDYTKIQAAYAPAWAAMDVKKLPAFVAALQGLDDIDIAPEHPPADFTAAASARLKPFEALVDALKAALG